MKKIPVIIIFLLSLISVDAQNWYQAGFKVSMQIPLNRDYATNIELLTLRNMHFTGFFRAGKYVYGEIGLGYHFFKGTYLFSDKSESVLESRYLTIPIKVVGDVKISKSVSFLPQVGISYQPLLKLAGDVITFDKSMLENHWTLLTAGFDMRFGFIIFGIDYRYSFQKFFKNNGYNNPKFLNICLGVQF